jgi:hypothetical protein
LRADKKALEDSGGDVERLIVVERELRTLETHPINESEVRDALERLDPVWDELFPAEQQRIVQLLVERVEVREDSLAVRLRADGLRSLASERSQDREAS